MRDTTRRTGQRRARRLPAALVASLLGATFVPLAVAEPASAQAVETGTWSQEEPAHSPTARGYFGSAYDAKLGQVVVFGGFNDGGNRNDTWVFDGVDWTQKTPNGCSGCPSARRYPALAYDAGLGETVLVGGRNTSSIDVGDTWVWNGVSWTQQTVTPAGSPGARSGAVMAYDAARAEVVLFGGYDGGGPGFLNDTWVWNGVTNTWTQKKANGCAGCPSARDGASVAYDPVRREVVLFGGEGSGLAPRNDTWVWNGVTWTPRTANGCSDCPPARRLGQMTFDPVRREVIAFGGRGGSGGLDDTWAWDGSAWAQRHPSSSPPAREGARLEFHAATGEAVLFGGASGAGGAYLDETWTFGAGADTSGLEPPFEWPSSDASCSAASNVIRGFVDGGFVQVRTGPEATGGTAVCVASDDGTRHLGGKLVVNGAPGSPVETDEQATACAADANNERVQNGMLLGQPYALDVTPLPDGDPDVAWVCVQAAGMGLRLVVTAAGAGAGTRFEPDALTTPPGGYAEEAWPVANQPSSYCKDTPGGTKTRLANLRVGGSDRVAFYVRRSGGTTDVCYRAATASGFSGARLTATASVAVPQVVFHDVDNNCPFPVFTRENPPTFGIWTDEPGIEPDGTVLFPNSVCVEVAGLEQGVSVTFAVDTATAVQQDPA